MEAITPRFAPGSEGLLTPLKPFFEDELVSEILINQPEEVFIERGGRMECIAMPRLDSMHLRRLFTLIANENGQSIGSESPLLSGNLTDGSRVQLVLPPAAQNYTLSIRRPSIKQLTLEDYRTTSFYENLRPFYLDENINETLSDEDAHLLSLYQQGLWADFQAQAVACKKNIVISGATSSGKTTYLNACTADIPHHERIITLEDTYEIKLPHRNVVRLLAPKKNDAQKTTLSMQDLVQCALRLRPDRLIMGEIRGREVLDFVSACSTGHEGSITSIHANNPRMAFMRMTQLYKQNNVPSMRDEDIHRELHAVIDVIIQVVRTKSGREAAFLYYKHAKDMQPLSHSNHSMELINRHAH